VVLAMGLLQMPLVIFDSMAAVQVNPPSKDALFRAVAVARHSFADSTC
jgi:hypothetical protein